LANFTEKATLRLIDETTANSKKIEATLKNLASTAKSTQSALGSLKAPASIAKSYDGITKSVNTLSKSLKNVGSASTSIKISGLKEFKAFADSLKKYRDAARGLRTLTLQAPNISAERVSRLRDLTTALRAYARAVASLPARDLRVPTLATTIASGAGAAPRPSPGQRNTTNQFAGRHNIILPSSAVNGLKSAITNAITYGFAQASIYTLTNKTAEGLKQRDVAENRINMQQLSPSDFTAAKRAISEITVEQGSTKLFNEGQVAGMFSEVLPMVKGDINATRVLSKELLSLAKMQVAAGETSLNAYDNAFNFAKAAEQTGKLSDEKGNFSASKATEFFDVLRGASSQIGREFSGSFVRNAIKYLQTSKSTLDNKAMVANFLMNEELGTQASVGLNQAIKQMTGNNVDKKVMSNLAALGLITTKEVDSGSVGGNKSKTRVMSSAIDQELASTNPIEFVNKYIKPLFKDGVKLDPSNKFDKNLLNVGAYKTDAEGNKVGLSMNNPVDAQKMSRVLASNQNAQSALSNVMLRYEDLMKSVERSFNRDNSKSAVDKAVQNSSTISFESFNNQITGAFGKIVDSLKGNFVGPLNSFSSGIDTFTSKLVGEKGSAEQGDAIAKAVAGSIAAAIGYTKLKNFVNPFSVASNKLVSAAGLHSDAAVQLTAAAKALSRSAALGAAGGAAGIGAAGAAAASKKVSLPSSGISNMGWFALATSAFSDIYSYSVKTRDEYKKSALEQLDKNGAYFDSLNEKAKTFFDNVLGPKSNKGLFGDNILGTYIKKVDGGAIELAIGDAAKKAGKIVADAIAGGANKPTSKLGADQAYQRMREKQARDFDVGNDEELKGVFRKLFSQVPEVSDPNNSFVKLPESLSTVSQKFDSAFISGASALSKVGTDIDSSAKRFGPTAGAGIIPFGSQFGSAAGQAIMSQIGNLKLNVNVSGSGVNTGSMSPKE